MSTRRHILPWKSELCWISTCCSIPDRFRSVSRRDAWPCTILVYLLDSLVLWIKCRFIKHTKSRRLYHDGYQNCPSVRWFRCPQPHNRSGLLIDEEAKFRVSTQSLEWHLLDKPGIRDKTVWRWRSQWIMFCTDLQHGNDLRRDDWVSTTSSLRYLFRVYLLGLHMLQACLINASCRFQHQSLISVASSFVGFGNGMLKPMSGTTYLWYTGDLDCWQICKLNDNGLDYRLLWLRIELYVIDVWKCPWTMSTNPPRIKSGFDFVGASTRISYFAWLEIMSNWPIMEFESAWKLLKRSSCIKGLVFASAGLIEDEQVLQRLVQLASRVLSQKKWSIYLTISWLVGSMLWEIWFWSNRLPLYHLSSSLSQMLGW